MMRLIDADALIESIEHSKGKNSIYAQYVRAYVKGEPTIEAEPVRHGRWIIDTVHKEEIYVHPVKCSACGQDSVLEFGTMTDYCPNCGAKMDGDADG